MSYTRESIAHALLVNALNGVKQTSHGNVTQKEIPNKTVTAYKRNCKRFQKWCREQGVKRPDQVNKDLIQRYEKDLEEDPKNYSPATIHAYLAPVCKGAGVPMDQISKPRRRGIDITRSRLATANEQGKRQAGQERFARVVSFQKAAGIRRSELEHLEGRDLIKGSDGELYIHVRRGKGGKEQYQRVLPKDRDVVEATFSGVSPKERVFSEEEMNNVIDFHGMRAGHARECYAYYRELSKDPEKAAELRLDLVKRWEQGHKRLKDQEPKTYSRARREFVGIVNNQEPYMLRGENRKRAYIEDLPVAYDRLALMAVSVYHLSHWRLDVTVVNYML